jgi:selenide,water dikinase
MYNDRWIALLERVRSRAGRMCIAVVGGGAGGVELVLAMRYRLRNELHSLGRDPDELEFHLFTVDNEILPTHNGRVRRSFDRVLAARGIDVHRRAEVTRVSPGCLTMLWRVDEIVWVTEAIGAPWLTETGLALDEHGFIQVDENLQPTTDPLIFAAGDIASMIGHPREKAGVFAVRQAGRWPQISAVR